MPTLLDVWIADAMAAVYRWRRLKRSIRWAIRHRYDID